MNGYLVALVLSAALAADDREPLTAADIKAAMDAQLHGREELGDTPPGPNSFFLPSVTPPVQPRAPGTVSVTTLRHKIPKKAAQAFERALKLSEGGDYAGAAVKLEEAVAIDPDFAQAHSNLGVQYWRLNRLDEAASELERSIQLDPVSSVAHANLAAVELRRSNLRQAEASARRALAISSTNDRARYLLALAIGGTPEMRAEAIENLEAAARTVPAARQLLETLRGEIAAK